MTRKLKMLGIALVAVLAMSSVVASAASAANDAFVADSAPVTLTGNQHNGHVVLRLAGQSLTCTTVRINATVSSTTTTEVTTKEPIFSGCSYAGQPATITLNGCRFIFTGTTNANGHAQMKLECEPGKTMHATINSAKCLVTVASQTAEEGYTITTTGTGTTKELTLHITAKLKVTSHPHPTHGIVCASLTNGAGALEGTLTVTGENPSTGAHIGVADEIVS